MSLSVENVRMMDGLYRLSYEGVPDPGNTVFKVEGSLMTFRDPPTGPLREATLEYGQVMDASIVLDMSYKGLFTKFVTGKHHQV